MNEAYRCPNCGSLGTRYRRTTGDHICQQCGHQWAILGVRTRPNRIKGAAITAVIGTVVGIGCAVGQGDFGVLIIAVATWVYTFFLLWRQSKRYSDDSTTDEYVGSENGGTVEDDTEAYYCTNPDCERELLGDEEFCIECGTRRVRPLAATQYLVFGSCKRKLEPTTQFCPGCGRQVIRR